MHILHISTPSSSCLHESTSADIAALPTGLSREEAAPTRCRYGTLPGGWIRSKGRALLPWHADNSLNMTFPVWQPYCSSCQMKPLLAPYLVVRGFPSASTLIALSVLGSPIPCNVDLLALHAVLILLLRKSGCAHSCH